MAINQPVPPKAKEAPPMPVQNAAVVQSPFVTADLSKMPRVDVASVGALLQPEKSPATWDIKALADDAEKIYCVNNVTGREFVGTRKEFGALLRS